MPKKIFRIEQNGNIETTPFKEYTYYSSGQNNKLREEIIEEKIHATYVWGYGFRYPLAKIDNATYNQVTNAFSLIGYNILQNTFQNINNKETLINVFNEVRTKLPSAFVTSYTYTPMVGVTSTTDARGQSAFYSYDGLGRLKEIRDHDNFLLNSYSYHYAYNPIYITTSSILPVGYSSIQYSYQIAVDGGTPFNDGTYNYVVVTGNLPQGYSLSNKGLISGTSHNTGVYSFVIKATDANGDTTQKEFKLEIVNPLIITTAANLTGACVNINYNQRIQATGGRGQIHSFSIVSGTLPHGISLSHNGVLTGVPNQTSENSFVIKVTNEFGETAQKTFSLSVVLKCTPTNFSFDYEVNGLGGFMFNGEVSVIKLIITPVHFQGTAYQITDFSGFSPIYYGKNYIVVEVKYSQSFAQQNSLDPNAFYLVPVVAKGDIFKDTDGTYFNRHNTGETINITVILPNNNTN